MRTSVVIAAEIGKSDSSVRGHSHGTGRKFNVETLPPDMLRVYYRLEEMFDEEYALTVMFTIRTAIGLHRAWHVSLLTGRMLQQLKDKFGLRISWNEGVTDLFFRIEDGLYELYRRVHYDYDSEFQNLYLKTAVALVEERINVHDALIFQSELKKGKHTCPSNLLLRNSPGRLLLYPFQAATCCVIFFEGDWRDAGIAALCGTIAGLIEWVLMSERFFSNGGDSKLLLDFLVGLSTGLIGGAFFFVSNDVCIRSVYLGTLYWFFYGTAFVIGFLEIIAGELKTGVTRLIAVSVKTFVLSVSSSLGLALLVRGDSHQVWVAQSQPQAEICNTMDLGNKWWRIPLYLLCSVSVLGQYRFIILNYWAGLLVQFVAYEVQYQAYDAFDDFHGDYGGMDRVFADLAGAASAVVAASFVAYIADFVKLHGGLNVIDRENEDKELSFAGKSMQMIYKCLVHLINCFGLGRDLYRRTSQVLAKLDDRSKKKGREKVDMDLSDEEKSTLVEAAIEAQEFNVWALLMPAIYQLVPGARIASVWYNVIFPNPVYKTQTIPEEIEPGPTSAERALLLTSVSLALGLILGLAVVRILSSAISAILSIFGNRSKSEDEIAQMNADWLRHDERQGFTHEAMDNDPDDDVDWSGIYETKWGLRNRA